MDQLSLKKISILANHIPSEMDQKSEFAIRVNK